MGMTDRKMKRGAILALGAIFAMFAANGETNLLSEVARRAHATRRYGIIYG